MHENLGFRRKLYVANKFIDNNEYLDGTVNTVTRNFILSQLRLQQKKSKGRRFTTDEKILSLSLFKRGPRVYKLLRSMFALPSRKTLMQMLNQIPLNVGINTAIIESLEESVQKLISLDRYCAVLFDEMILRPGLQYNTRTDFIVGFQDTGYERKTTFADHAFVFMVRGIRRRWKQPLSYYFSSGSLSSAEIAKHLKLVIRTLESIGLVVTATVCDQGSSNIAAINAVVRETQQKLIREGRECEVSGLFGFIESGQECEVSGLFGFIESGREILPLYDTPHLLKGMKLTVLSGLF